MRHELEFVPTVQAKRLGGAFFLLAARGRPVAYGADRAYCERASSKESGNNNFTLYPRPFGERVG